MPVHVRPGRPSDRDFVVSTAARFAVFGPPPWRTADEVVGGEVRCLDEYYAGRMPGCELVIAEDEAGQPAGFAFLEPHVDYFSGETHGHLGMIAVTAGAEGTGAGAALMEAAEAWCRDRGYARLTLNVFERNARARAFYERRGFAVETLRYTKALG
jgi:GNAT superfamily N-acetyltransferase